MNVDQIRARLKTGFRPFAVVVSSGDRFPVPHPEFIFLTQGTVIIADERGYVLNLDPLHIVGLEDLPRRTNGKSKRPSKPSKR